jgi:hypothetical protein
MGFWSSIFGSGGSSSKTRSTTDGTRSIKVSWLSGDKKSGKHETTWSKTDYGSGRHTEGWHGKNYNKGKK